MNSSLSIHKGGAVCVCGGGGTRWVGAVRGQAMWELGEKSTFGCLGCVRRASGCVQSQSRSHSNLKVRSPLSSA
eukprot:360092-Chlamydomonas_euryale.AAC.2